MALEKAPTHVHRPQTVQTSRLVAPVHLQPYYQALGFAQGDFPEAEHYYAEAISLPIYPGLSDSEQDYVVQQVRRWIQEPSIS